MICSKVGPLFTWPLWAWISQILTQVFDIAYENSMFADLRYKVCAENFILTIFGWL